MGNYICPICRGSNVSAFAYVNLNTQKFVEWVFDEITDKKPIEYCEDCREWINAIEDETN